MAEVLNQPQFQVLTHRNTGEKTGRIYFPALFLAEFYRVVINWLKYSNINFDSRDIKEYGDGSFRLYFKTYKEPELAYFRLIQMAERGLDIR
ncbi:hypothetical protein [Brunnivagina elsteri]|uniref:Uncharacterized protein n=1 Tax=Brunnivagina elsteri CCALA 953 TaxID=987040 RepID=A0A2A2TPY3_9CYAN|nr:hypothetical protein [Calothrix elsteri]PAX60510.1 hypothetical protein CK510_01490 [Calothrix elsteri CCALA 953]